MALRNQNSEVKVAVTMQDQYPYLFTLNQVLFLQNNCVVIGYASLFMII